MPAVSFSFSILLVYVLLRLPGIGVPLDRDEGAFGYIGQVINRGGLPYLDALDHKPPVAFFINAFALRLVPPTAEGMHTFLLAYNFLTLVCLFLIARIYFRSISVALWTAFAFAVFSASPAINGFTASTEMYALLPTVLSLLLAVAGMRNNRMVLLFLSGVAGATACWTKQTAFTSVLFVFLFICTGALRGPVRNWKIPAVWLGGAVLFSACVVFYFYAHGILEPFIYWCFTYELDYASVPFSETLKMLPYRLGQIARGDFVFPAAGLVVAVAAAIRRDPRGFFLGGFLLLSFLGTVPGYVYPHYFVQIAPAVALAGGYAFSVFVGKRSVAALAAGLAVVAISAGVNREYFLGHDATAISRRHFGVNPFPEARQVADFIAKSTTVDDRVLIVGSEPEILFYAQRRSATPFVMIYPLTSEHGRYKEFQNTLWADVLAKPPKYIVDLSGDEYSVGWDEDADLEILRSLKGFIAQNYVLQRRMPVFNYSIDLYAYMRR
ncbi:MAG TPA: hypothetical protein VG273_14910 [Bryobacteraceae bacterium]|nr:hypothetical protein [Bryobacteraceae bacterium]